jgi:hypothetical protein
VFAEQGRKVRRTCDAESLVVAEEANQGFSKEPISSNYKNDLHGRKLALQPSETDGSLDYRQTQAKRGLIVVAIVAECQCPKPGMSHLIDVSAIRVFRSFLSLAWPGARPCGARRAVLRSGRPSRRGSQPPLPAWPSAVLSDRPPRTTDDFRTAPTSLRHGHRKTRANEISDR